MESYYVKTDVPEFSEQMEHALKAKGLKQKRALPVDFLFLSADAAFYRNRVDTKQTTWFSLLWGKSVDVLTNKIHLHTKYNDSQALIQSTVLTPEVGIPSFSGRKLKILKPLKGYQGHGITVVSNSDQAEEWLEQHSMYEEWLLQDYIKTPALKDGYKFHLRVLVVVKKEHRTPVEVFVSTHKFYVKAEEPYKQDDWLNPRIHDTHYKPGKVEVFPQSLPDEWTEKDARTADKKLTKYIQELFKDETDFKPDWNAKNGFEIFGVDVLFDKKRPYILEINNKISLKGRYSYAAPVVDLILDKKADPYFVQII